MSTRYSLPNLPSDHDNAELTRIARGLVALVLVVGLLVVVMWAAVVPPRDSPMASTPDTDPLTAPVSASVRPGA